MTPPYCYSIKSVDYSSVFKKEMQLLLTISAALLVLVSLVVRELCKPPDQGWRVPGRTKKAWKLPPGPAGMPIVGNLSQFFRARDSGRLIPYVRAQNFETYTLSPSCIVQIVEKFQFDSTLFVCSFTPSAPTAK